MYEASLCMGIQGAWVKVEVVWTLSETNRRTAEAIDMRLIWNDKSFQLDERVLDEWVYDSTVSRRQVGTWVV